MRSAPPAHAPPPTPRSELSAAAISLTEMRRSAASMLGVAPPPPPGVLAGEMSTEEPDVRTGASLLQSMIAARPPERMFSIESKRGDRPPPEPPRFGSGSVNDERVG
eukprot:6690966-Prymnesium_polylepis.1